MPVVIVMQGALVTMALKSAFVAMGILEMVKHAKVQYCSPAFAVVYYYVTKTSVTLQLQ